LPDLVVDERVEGPFDEMVVKGLQEEKEREVYCTLASL